MASHDSFRARRSFDPKPVNYGSFIRESRNTSSLNDLNAAWENVDEARSALQAVEARIQEANYGLRLRRTQEPHLEPAVREVFSQNQRLGRVSRYELQPTINEHQYPIERELSTQRNPSKCSSSTRKSTTDYSSYSKFNGSNSVSQHSPPSRDRAISPMYFNDTDDNSDKDGFSFERNLDSDRTRDAFTTAGVLGTSKLDDSAEASSLKRKRLNGLKPLSPLSSICDKSDALARLKDRIQKQKERTPVPKQKENEDTAVNIIQPMPEEKPIINEETFVKPVCKRKVVIAPPPTGYKGFSIPNVTQPSSKDWGRTQSRNSSSGPSTKPGQKRTSVSHKSNQNVDGKASKGGVKMRRIVAPKAPMDFITPYSWRTGMETVNKVLGPSNTRPKSSASTRPQSTASQETTSTVSRMGIAKWKEDKIKEKEGKSPQKEEPLPEEKANDTLLSEGLLSEGLLSEDAKNVLSDLELDNDISDVEEELKLKESRPKQDKTANKTVIKVKSSPNTMPPKSCVQRHYDVDKVKSYMEKKIKDRKLKLREEKKMKQEAIDGRKKRLETLYNKQKKILATNLNQNSCRSKLGETHSIIPGHFSYQHQQIGYLPEFFTQDSGSDKEGTDVASFTGLPTPPERGQQRSSPRSCYSDKISDTSSDLSLQSLNDSHEKLPSSIEVEKEENQADITLTPLKSSCNDNEILNGDAAREERLEKMVYPSVSVNAAQPSSSTSRIFARTDRIEALKTTAADLKNRLEQEARRLGLTMLDKGQDEPPFLSKGLALKEPDVFRGNLPGVSNLHEQSELNDKLENMNSAATRIQAVYRGYSTRQGLDWKLPSGRTLGGIIRNAPRHAAVEGRAESIPLFLASDTSGDSHLSDVETAYSHDSDRSLPSRNKKAGISMLESRSSTVSSRQQSKAGSSRTSISNGHYRPSTTLGKTLTDCKGDRMSVINIYLRNLSSLRQDKGEVVLDSEKKDDTTSLYSGDFQLNRSSDHASLVDDNQELKDGDSVDLDKTLVKESPARDSIVLEHDLEKSHPSEDLSFSHSVSSNFSPSESFSLSQTDTEYSPIRLSERSPSPTNDIGTSTHPGQPASRCHPPLYYPSHQGGHRMSPGSLDQRMLAELNRLEFMEESVRQLTDIEKTKAVSLAQQETVSLAQILKAKQAAYAKEMEALQMKAQKEKLEAARELEEARFSAKKSSFEAQKAMAKVKAEAADTISQSADRLVKAQTEAARVTTDSARKVEEARSEAARALLDAANHQVTDVRSVVSSAASAAAQEAVRTTLEQFRQELRPSRKYDDSYNTPYGRSRSSYSRGSYTDERTTSYSRSRSSRTASKKDSGASKAIDSNGYTSDEFESIKESETGKSTQTSSPDHTHASNQGSFIQDRVQSGTKSGESIAEEVDASVSEGSLVSDSLIADKSIEEAIDDHKGQTNNDYSMTFEESMVSSRNVTDDEMDYRLILPSEGHRRRSLGKTQRSGSVCSDAVSYSSDENLEKHLSESVHEKNTPFSAEDSFSKFTADMVKLMREEEVRAKHLEALLHLREKALKENTKAEMEWLEMQKKQMRDKGADDAMPFIKKRQRDVIKRLKTEKAEIKYMMAAHRAARHDRRLMMINQEEITRLRRSTLKIRGKVREEEQSRDKSDVPEEISGSHSRRSTPVSTSPQEDQSPSKSTTVPEEISAIESPTTDTSFPTYENESTISERVRKRSLSEGESDDGTPSISAASKSKGSPSSDSIVMQQLKKLKSQSSERYLTQREQKLMRRKHECEDLSDRKLLEWERRLDEEENKLNDKNRIRSKRAIKATQNKPKGEDFINMAPGRSREASIPEVDFVSKDFSETSDHSDVETRVRELREQLQQREHEVRRLHKEQKRQKRAMLHEEEENLRKKLQAVERILQKTKENLERPSTLDPPEVSNTSGPGQSTPRIESFPEKLTANDSAMNQSQLSTYRNHSMVIEGASIKAQRSNNNIWISERPDQRRSTSEDRSTSHGKQSDTSPSGDGPFKGLNVVLDLDFISKEREGITEPKSISEIKDLDISDRSGVFDKEADYTPFSETEEIRDVATTGENISQASEIQTVSEGSEIKKSSEPQSRQPSISENISKRSGLSAENSQRSNDDSIVEVISERSSASQNTESISKAIPTRSSKPSESTTEDISHKSSQRCNDESISEDLSKMSSLGSRDESISEELSERSPQRSDDGSIPEDLSKEPALISGSIKESPSEQSKSNKRSGNGAKLFVHEYSNTFESEPSKDETDDDISEQIIQDEGGVAENVATAKPYSSDFHSSESNNASNLEIKEESVQNTSAYSQDFETTASNDKTDKPAEKGSLLQQSLEGDKPVELTQYRLSEATDEESIAEEISEEDKLPSVGEENDEAGHFEVEQRVDQTSMKKGLKDLSEESASHYSQYYESNHSLKHDKGLSDVEDFKQESEKVVLPCDPTEEETTVGKKSGQESVEFGSLTDASIDLSPRFAFKERTSFDEDKSQKLSDTQNFPENITIEEKDRSEYSQNFDSSSSYHEETKPSSIVQQHTRKSAARDNVPEPHLDEISAQRRLSDGTDDESVLEELPDEQVSVESDQLSDKKMAPPFVVHEEKADDVVPLSPTKADKDISSFKNRNIRSAPTKPFIDKDMFRQQQADRIALELSSALVDDAIACVSNLYDEHKLIAIATPQPNQNKTQSNTDSKLHSDKDEMNEWGKPPEEGFEISEGEDLSISERLSFSDDDALLPIDDMKPLAVASKQSSQAVEPEESYTPEISKQAENEQVLQRLSENLLKEAATKMISLMRLKQAKQKQAENIAERTQKLEKIELPKSPPPHGTDLSPRGFDKCMEVLKPTSPPGSPTKDGVSIDSDELTDKLTQLKLLHDQIGSQLGDDEDDDDFIINTNKPLELPTDKEEYGPPSGQTIPIIVPHSSEDVIPIVSSSLATLYQRKISGRSLGSVTPPHDFSETSVDESDPDAKTKQSYRRMIFDLTGEVFRDVLNEEFPVERPPWMKPRRRRKNRFYHTLSPVMDEHEYLPIVQQRVLDLVGLGNERPNLDTLRRKTPLKLGKKDFVDAVLIQELREEEPQWVDYDDDELAVKFQVADAIFESLMSETVMVLHAVQRRKESMNDVR